jgi:carboxyl-terminal processing protease
MQRLWLSLSLLVWLLAAGGAGAARAADPAAEENLLERLRTFNDILRLVRANYVDEVDAAALMDGAIDGLLEELDPHSNYVDPKRSAAMNERYRGEYFGIGISFAIRDGYLTVISPIEGSPSDRLGIRAGDRIVKINGESAMGISENEVFEKLRGPEGTSVHVSIQRPGREELIELDITRERIALKSVPYAFMLDEETGYVRMVLFSATTGQELETALDALEAAGMKRLLLDLRGNAGGLLEQAVEVADKFIDGRKLLVYQKGRVDGANEEHYATDADRHPRMPLIILVDHGSASASEIVAGAVQDWDRGLVAGQTSFGKGLVQRQFRLRDGSALFLTIARYYTPSGRLIQRDYVAGDRTEYYAEGLDDDDPNASPDSTAARPVFHTAAGRTVYGGGGITPDVAIEPPTFTSAQEAIERASLPFTFANAYVGRSGFTYPAGFDRYLADYEMTEATWREFLDHAAQSNAKITREELTAERAYIARSVKREVAGNVWGPTERYRVLLASDPVLKEARTLFPRASEFLAMTAKDDGLPGVGTHGPSPTPRTAKN